MSKKTSQVPAKTVLHFRPEQQDLVEMNAVARVWGKDASLWKADPAVQRTIRQRLGWLTLPVSMKESVTEMNDFLGDVRKFGVQDVVLLGMGGSSLCPEVLRLVFGNKSGFPRLHVLDTTDPMTIADVRKKTTLKKTLFLVASKSGDTIEVTSLFRYFWDECEKEGLTPSQQFIAITDPGTPLETLAKDRGFRKIFVTPTDVGDRFSALTFFGLVPGVLLGLDVKKILDRAERMADLCAPDVPPEDNPALRLAAWWVAGVETGRDKMTLVTSPKLSGFGLWAEQLVAESTGKEGTGILPVHSEKPRSPSKYPKDRLFICLTLKGDKNTLLEQRMTALEKEGHPVWRIFLDDLYDLGAEFFRWEMATALAGSLMGINPFDEPNVSETKNNTLKILANFEKTGILSEPQPMINEKGIGFWDFTKTKISGTLDRNWGHALSSGKRGDYIALMAYTPSRPDIQRALEKLKDKIEAVTGLAVTLGYGPRFLHSTGQLHKGGGANGLFIQITTGDSVVLEIPKVSYGFSALKRAQALGDVEALKNHHRRGVRVHLTNTVKDLGTLTRMIQ